VLLRFLRILSAFRALEAERDTLASSKADYDRATARVLDLEARDDSRIQRIMALDSEKEEAIRERDELRATLQEQNTQCLLLQDRLDASQESVSRLWGMVDDAQKRAYRAMEMQVNFCSQQRFGMTPYPDASQLPPSLEPDLESDTVVPRRRMPSEMIADAKRNLVTELHQRLTKKPA
jgi:hypothetical protein